MFFLVFFLFYFLIILFFVLFFWGGVGGSSRLFASCSGSFLKETSCFSDSLLVLSCLSCGFALCCCGCVCVWHHQRRKTWVFDNVDSSCCACVWPSVTCSVWFIWVPHELKYVTQSESLQLCCYWFTQLVSVLVINTPLMGICPPPPHIHVQKWTQISCLWWFCFKLDRAGWHQMGTYMNKHVLVTHAHNR